MESLGHEPMNELVFATPRAAEDIHQFMQRAKDFETEGVRFQARQDVLALTVSVMGPRGLGDQVPTVLGMRTVKLYSSNFDGLDAVFELAAVTDRTARMSKSRSQRFSLPPVQLSVSWTAVAPPKAGWELKAVVDDEELRQIAQNGIEELGSSLPDQPGQAMVSQARGHVWGKLIGDPQQVAFPAGSALAGHVLGFLQPAQESRVFVSGPWIRIANARGTVITRPAISIG